LFLVPYSPEFDLIKNAFAKLKAVFFKAAVRAVEGFWAATTLLPLDMT
jgi:hypothetical protein